MAYLEVSPMAKTIPPPIIPAAPPLMAANRYRAKTPIFAAIWLKPDAAMAPAERMAAVQMTVPALASSWPHSIPPMK